MKRLSKLLLVVVASLTILSGCTLPGLSGSDKDSIKITALATSESQIMSHMVRLMIEHETDGILKPTLINNLGSSTIQHNAIENGDAQISGVRYTGTDLTGALGDDPVKDPKEALELTQKGFEERFDTKFFDSYGFANSYSFMVTRDTAEKYDLTTISDLEEYKDELHLGVDSSWMNRKGDGYPGFIEEYGFRFNSVSPMQIGLVYDALNAESIDVALGYTTDGRIAAYDLVVLEDDRQFFPPYDASPLATNALLETHPEVERALEKLVGKVSTETMQQLNYRADGEGIEPAVVAEEFLEEHNYFDEEGEK